MHSPVPSLDAVRSVVAERNENGTPVTTGEVATAFDAPDELVAEQLEALVDAGELRVRSVDGAGRLWWRPPAHATGTAPDDDSFRAELEDRLRSLTDPVAIQESAATHLADRLDVDRALYLEVFPDGETLQVQAGYGLAGNPEMRIKHRFSDFGEDIEATLRGGAPLVVDDVTDLGGLSDEQEAAYLDNSIRAYLTVPLLRDDRLVGLFTLHQSTPRQWDETAVALTRATVERTWEAVERGRSERELAATNDALEQLTRGTRDLIEADVETVRTEVAALALSALDCASTALWWYDDDAGDLRHVRTETAPERAPEPDWSSAACETTAWETFVSADPTVENDIGSPDGVPSDPAAEPLRSRMFVSLGRHGVLGVAATEPGWFDGRRTDLVATVAATAEAVWDRAAGEAELQRQNRELRRLDALNTLIRGIDQALVRAETVAEIDETVCERLADSELYEFAWIGGYDAEAAAVSPRAWAGIESSTLSKLVEAPAGASGDQFSEREEPFLAAIQSGELQTVADVATDPRAAGWREVALERGARSCRCLPLVYEGAVYGVLTVYGDAPNPDEDDGAVLSELAGTIAHAIHAVETSATRQTDRVVELTLRTAAAETPLCQLSRDTGCRIDSDGAVSGDPDDPTVLFTASGVDPDELLAAAADSLLFSGVSVVRERDDATLFRAQLTGEPLAARFRDRAAIVGSVRIDAGTATVVVTLPETADVREYVDDRTGRIPDLELVARRSRDRGPGMAERLRSTFQERLTPRQQEVFSLAYHAGFFESPRARTGAELADELGIAQSTFNYHLRGAQRALCGTLFDAE